MNKKFKEYRMLLITSVLFVLFLGVGTFYLIKGQRPQMIGGYLLATIAFFLLTVRYRMALYDEYMVIYEWKVAAMLPTLIDYKDIQEIKKVGKHHIKITHTRTSHIYVLHSEAFIASYEAMRQLSD